MSISLKQINNEIVKPVKIQAISSKNIQGYDLFPELYANIFLLAKKKSGKTSTISTILKRCVNKNTKVVIFASTVEKDATWKSIVKWLAKKNIYTETFTSLIEDKVNFLEHIIKDVLLQSAEGNDEGKPKFTISFSDDEEESKSSKPKKIAPEYIIIFDDLSSELKNKFIPVLLKANRHFKCKILISSQYYNDIPKDGRMQLDYILMYPNIPSEKLVSTYEDLDLAIPFQTFLQCYMNATATKYNFLYVDVREEKLRKNFNLEYQII